MREKSPGEDRRLQRYVQTIGKYGSLTSAEAAELRPDTDDGAQEPLDLPRVGRLHGALGLAREFLDRALSYKATWS